MSAETGPTGDPGGVRVVVFDVNETLSDLAPMRERFADVGADEGLAATWFASVLRDGMALATVGEQARFADLGRAALRTLLPSSVSGSAREDAADHVLGGFMDLPVHPDVADGMRALREQGLRLVTLSNGAAAVAEGLLERNGLADLVEATLSVEDAGIWKPAGRAYQHAVDWSGEPAGAHLLVAVHPWDVHGAQQAGLRGAFVDRAGDAAYPEFFGEPDLRVRDLPDLAERLSG